MGLTVIDENNIYQNDVIGKVRTAQEDSHDMAALTPNGDVFVVCDGMGGHVGGKQASSIAVKSILEYLKKEKYGNPLQALNEALQFANMQILGYANEHPELKGMGTTACVLLLHCYEAYIAHAGDSRIYFYLGKEKQLHRITKDHSLVQTLVDTGEISDEEAEHHPNKNRILKALGIKSALEPTFSVEPVLPKNGDVFLICSDGLCGMISDSTIRNVLSHNTTIKQKGDMLINLALEEGGLDNITLQLIQISNSPHKKSVFESHNPKGRRQFSVSRSNNLMQIVKWVAVAIIGLAVAYLIYCVVGKQQVDQPQTKKDNAQQECDILNDTLDAAIKAQKSEEENSKKGDEEKIKAETKAKAEKPKHDSVEKANAAAKPQQPNVNK
jgi:protein phosphatase